MQSLALALALLEAALALVGLASVWAWWRAAQAARREAKAKERFEHCPIGKAITSGKYQGQPYQVLEGKDGYEAQLRKFKTPKPGNQAMQAYLDFARLHEAAVRAGGKA